MDVDGETEAKEGDKSEKQEGTEEKDPALKEEVKDEETKEVYFKSA